MSIITLTILCWQVAFTVVNGIWDAQDCPFLIALSNIEIHCVHNPALHKGMNIAIMFLSFIKSTTLLLQAFLTLPTREDLYPLTMEEFPLTAYAEPPATSSMIGSLNIFSDRDNYRTSRLALLTKLDVELPILLSELSNFTREIEEHEASTSFPVMNIKANINSLYNMVSASFEEDENHKEEALDFSIGLITVEFKKTKIILDEIEFRTKTLIKPIFAKCNHLVESFILDTDLPSER